LLVRVGVLGRFVGAGALKQGLSRRFAARATFVLGKSSQNRQRRRKPAFGRSPALLAGNGTARELAALRHPRLFGRFQLRCSACFKALKIKI
jgi:hypothetical protein